MCEMNGFAVSGFSDMHFDSSMVESVSNAQFSAASSSWRRFRALRSRRIPARVLLVAIAVVMARLREESFIG